MTMSKKVYSYQVSLTELEHGGGRAKAAMVPLLFRHENHDDLSLIVERVQRTSGLDADSAAATAVGLKLLSEVMLRQRDNPLFDVLREPIGEFIRSLKAQTSRGGEN
jgi:hypothetical protein